MKKNTLLALLIIVFAIMVGSYTLITNEDWWGRATSIVYLIPPVMSVLGGLYLLKLHGIRKNHFCSHEFIVSGVALWFLAEILWVVLDYLGIAQSASLADFFYVIAYLPLFFGFLKEIGHSKIVWTAKKLSIVLPSIAILGFVTIYYGVIGAYDPEISLVETGINMFYGVGDLLLSIVATLTLMVVLEYQGGKIFFPWMHLLIGIVLFLSADILYALYYLPYINGEWPYRLMDLLWGLSYLFFAYGFFSMGFLIEEKQERISFSLKTPGE